MSAVQANSVSSPNGTSPAQSTTSNRLERRKEWWSKHKEVCSKLRDRATLSKKENFQLHHLSLAKVDTSRGFRSTNINLLAASAKKSPPSSKSGQSSKLKLKPKSKPQKAASSIKQSKSARHDKKYHTTSAKQVTQPKTESVVKSEDFKQELLSEVVIKTRDVVDINAASPIPSNYVLFIDNLPFDITKEQLMDHFRKTGGVKSVRIPKEKGSGKGRGFAYMEFKDRISHGIALRLHHTTLCGRRINVEFQSSEKQAAKGKDAAKQENGDDQSQSSAA